MANVDWVGVWGQSNTPRIIGLGAGDPQNRLWAQLLTAYPSLVLHERWNGGQSIDRWVNDDCSFGDLLTTPGGDGETYISDMQNSLNAIITAGDTPIPRAFYWIQGEADARSVSRANSYYAQLCCLQMIVLDEIQTITGIRPPFIFMVTRNEDTALFTDPVSNVTETLTPAEINATLLNPAMKRAAADHGLIAVESNDAEREDAVHLAGTGDNLVADRMAQALADYEANGGDAAAASFPPQGTVCPVCPTAVSTEDAQADEGWC